MINLVIRNHLHLQMAKMDCQQVDTQLRLSHRPAPLGSAGDEVHILALQ